MSRARLVANRDIVDGSIIDADINASAAIAATKVSGVVRDALVNAKGDLVTATANDTPAVLTVGANDTVLTADSSTATGLAWKAAAGGKIVQVVRDTDTSDRSTTSTTLTDVTGVSVSITPTSASNNILLILIAAAYTSAAQAIERRWGMAAITTSGNTVVDGRGGQYFGPDNYSSSTTANFYTPLIISAWASPNSTSTQTYKVRFSSGNASCTVGIDGTAAETQLYAIEVAP